MNNKIVVVNVYQCASLSGKYQKEGKKLLRSNAKMIKTSVDEANQNWQSSGRLYEIDEKATEQWRKDFEAQQEKKREIREVKEELKETILDSIGVAVKDGKRNARRKPKAN